MRRVMQFLCVFLFTTIIAGSAFAQAPRAQLRAVTASEPTLQEALRDPEVRAALREHVHGIDIDRAIRQYGNMSMAPAEGEAESDRSIEFHPIPEGEWQALERRSDRRNDRRPPRLRDRRDAPPRQVDPERPHFDPQLYTSTLEALLQNNVYGYAMQIRQHGQVIASSTWGNAQGPQDANLGWTVNRRQHVASISKFITAMGLTRMLDAETVSFDASIVSYLPAHWQVGPNVDDITFAHLMNHVSGFSTGGSGSSYQIIQAQVAQGVPANAPGNPLFADYENMNFGLCRFLMATLGGFVDTDAYFGATYNDIIWDWVATVAYANYIQDNVFAPAGVNGAVLANQSASARAYAWNDTGEGWDSESFTGEAGGVGWHLSVSEILDVVSEFRRGGGIVSSQRAMEVMNASYGLNSPIGGFEAETGRFFYKPGRWYNGSPDHQAEQALALILPEGYEIAILVNSPLGPQDMGLQEFGGTLYLLSIVGGE